MPFTTYHLKKGSVTFNVLSEGYNIQEEVQDIISEVRMEAGNRVRKYGNMPKTNIVATLRPLNATEMREYLVALEDGEYEFYSEKYDDYRSKIFFVTVPEVIEKQRNGQIVQVAPFEVTLEQSDEVSP